MRVTLYAAAPFVALLVLAGHVSSQTYTIVPSVTSNGAVSSSNSNYSLTGTLQQTAIAASTGDYQLQHGFWPWIRSLEGCCIGVRGNEDGDIFDIIDVGDVTYLADFLFSGGDAPTCSEEGDANGDSAVDISDLGYLTDYVFFGGSAPPSCP